MEEQLDLYDKAMRNLDRMAAADLQDWWEAGNRLNHSRTLLNVMAPELRI